MFAYTKLMQAMAAAGVVSATDPYFNLTTLLLPGNGTNGAQNNTFIDSSTNNFTITRNGNTTQGTFSPFSQTGWANYFDGSSAYLTLADNVAFEPGTGDFTIEAWVYDTVAAGTLNVYIAHSSGGVSLYRNASGKLEFAQDSVAAIATSTNNIPVNSWNHVAVSRSGTSLKLFINGAQEASVTNSTNLAGTGSLGIGASSNGSNKTTGYISNLRLVKGTAVYTAAFTPPTSALTAIANTQLLTCQSNRFIDNSSNAFAITVNGSPSVQAFSPFAPTAAYSAATNGGSGYFDGSGDYLTVPNNSALNLAGTSWTVECWIYPTVLGGAAYRTIMGKRQNLSGEWELGLDTSDFIYFWNGTARTGTIKPTLNAWNHLAATHDGTNLRMFVNGALAFGPTAVTLTNTTDNVGIGAVPGGGQPITGYLSNCRVTKGGALYTAAFTPPTAPFTTTVSSGTVSLLTNFTNGGIIDATGKNALETVGNAQISTTQSKFGGSSMYFDGTGDSLFISDVKAVTNLAAFRTGDFTIEMWVYPTANPSTYGAIPNVFGSSDGWGIHYMPSSAANPSTIRFDTFVSTNYAANNAVPLNQWTHIAVTRSGSSLKFWVNGTQSGSTATVTENFNMTSATFSLGNSVTVSREFFGYIDDFRITKGYARYTSNFTPPSAAFPLQ